MTDSYHFQIEPEPRVEVPKFRIGGYYWSQGGDVMKITDLFRAVSADCLHKFAVSRIGVKSGKNYENDGGRYADGSHFGDPSDESSLIPGELVQRDGQWVAADSIGPFGSGATLKTSGDKIVGRVEAISVCASSGSSYTSKTPHSVVVTVLGAGGGGGTNPLLQGKPVEPIRPALDWNTATPFDTFGADFIVTKGEVPTAPLYDSPTTDSAYPAIAGLLRG